MADTFSTAKRSYSSFSQVLSATRHTLTVPATPAMSDLDKLYKRRHPPTAKNDEVPDIHQILSQLQQGPVPLRTHILTLLACLGAKRPSCLARMWRHNRTLRFGILRIDAPSWANTYPSNALSILNNLGWLDCDSLNHNQFIKMQIRSYRPKSHAVKGQIYSNWVTLLENRFCPKLCPVLTMANYLLETADCKIATHMVVDGRTVKSITDDRGHNHCSAKALFITAKGASRKAIKANTISGILKREILRPAGITHDASALRATSVSWLMGYGTSMQTCMSIGNWSSEATFLKHYKRLTITPIDPSRLSDTTLHDWKLVRAHTLLDDTLRPLDAPARTSSTDTSNDASIAAALSGSLLTRSKRRRLSRR